MAEGEDLCSHCGAPHVTGYAACKYCKTPFVRNTQTNAIPCPRCSTLNELGAQKCVQCQTWLVVQCVFCHALSAHNTPACSKCGEAFAGAPQRFAERQSQQRLQTGLNIAGQVGNVAASLAGAAAVAGVFGGHSHHHGYPPVHHHQQGYGGGPDYGPDYDRNPGAGIAQESGSSGGGFFDSIFGGSSSSDSGGTGAGIAQESGSSGGGFLDSVFGGSSSDSSSSSSDTGSSGSFWDSGSSDSSSSSDSGGNFWDSDD